MEKFGNCRKFVNDSKNINTKKATNNWMGVYFQWSGVIDKETCIEKLPFETLDVIL